MNFCDALTSFWNNLGDDWAGLTNVAFWMPSARLLPRDAFPDLNLKHWGCCRDTEYGELNQISGWIILKQLFLKSSHNGEMFFRKLLSNCWKKWAKPINRGINAVKKDALSFSLSKNAWSQTRSSPSTIPPEPAQFSLLAPGVMGFVWVKDSTETWHCLCFSDSLITWSTEEPSSPEAAGPSREVNL